MVVRGWTERLMGSDRGGWASFVAGKEGLLRWSIRNEMARFDPALPSAWRALLAEEAEALAWERFFLERRSLARYADDLDRRLILLGRWCAATVLAKGGGGKTGSRHEGLDAIASGAGPLQLAEARDDLRRVAEAVCRTLARMPPRSRRLLEERFVEGSPMSAIAIREGCGVPRVSRLLGLASESFLKNLRSRVREIPDPNGSRHVSRVVSSLMESLAWAGRGATPQPGDSPGTRPAGARA